MSLQVVLDAKAYSPAELTGCRDAQLARWVSDALCPPVVAAISILVAAARLATPAAWGWAVLFLAWAVAAPTLYVVWLLYRGEVTDFHLRVREQRLKPMLLTVAATASAWLVLIVRRAPPLLVNVATAGLAMTAVICLITLRWKISGHTTAISGLAVLCWWLAGPVAAPVALSVPLVAWARVRLRRHTLAQTIAGAALGLLTTWAFYMAGQGR